MNDREMRDLPGWRTAEIAAMAAAQTPVKQKMTYEEKWKAELDALIHDGLEELPLRRLEGILERRVLRLRHVLDEIDAPSRAVA